MDTSRQETLVVAKPKVYHIVGCGGVGSWIALWLAKALPDATFHLWDGDLVEASNLHRTPYNADAVGHVKSYALCDILEDHGARTVFTHNHWTEDVSMIEHGDTVISAVDSMKVRRELYDTLTSTTDIKAADTEYWDVGAEGTGCNVSDSPADFEIDGADAHEGYFTPIFIGPVTMAASIVVWRILRGYSPPTHQRVEELDDGPDWRTE
jgi:hypothetical protein